MTTRTLNAEITIGQIKAALLFAAKNDVRRNLEGACIDHTPTGVRMVATDGLRFICMRLNDTPVEGEPTRYVVARNILETIVKGWAKVDSVGFTWEQDCNPDPTRAGVTVVSPARVHAHGIPTVDVQDAMGKYPGYERIIPKTCSGEIAQYNADFIADCAKARKALGAGLHSGAIAIAHNGDGPGLIRLTEDAIAVVMPFRTGKSDVPMSPPEWLNAETPKPAKEELAVAEEEELA